MERFSSAEKPRRGVAARGANPIRAAIGRVDKGLYASGWWTASTLTLPDFIGIGTSQGGSTWLHRNLACHPGIYSPKKEVKYFNNHFHRSLASYAARFEPGRGRVKGEITPEYAILPRSRIQFIRKVMPALRLIYVIRDPIDRSWSMCRRRFSTHQGRRLADVDEAEFIEFLRAQPAKPKDYGSGIEYNRYLRNIDNWLSEFPEEQLFVGFYQDIALRPKQLLTNVFRHLGVDLEVAWDDFPYQNVINPNPAFPMPARCREVLIDIYRDDIEEMYRRFGSPVAAWRV